MIELRLSRTGFCCVIQKPLVTCLIALESMMALLAFPSRHPVGHRVHVVPLHCFDDGELQCIFIQPSTTPHTHWFDPRISVYLLESSSLEMAFDSASSSCLTRSDNIVKSCTCVYPLSGFRIPVISYISRQSKTKSTYLGFAASGSSKPRH